MTKVNGTDAKTIALHFLNHTTDGRYTPAVIAKTINQAKSLLRSGYTVDEVCATIDYVIETGIQMYSIGYINTCIGNVLKIIEEVKFKEEVAQIKQKQLEELKEKQGEVNVDVESTERNRGKIARFGVQSGFGKKHNLDMFEGQRQDN